jgi:uncharacterized protein (TIGR00725 family)
MHIGFRRLRIGVMGPSRCGTAETRAAEAVGRRIGTGGALLICGGGPGVMEAAARGASESGGLVVGILPGEREDQANPYVDIPIVTGMGQARNAINVLTSHALIAIGGGGGTLSEIALALRAGIPVVALRSWTISPPLGTPDPPGLHVTGSPRAAVALAFRLARARVASHGNELL